MNELAESLDSQTASLLAHNETNSVHKIRLSCDMQQEHWLHTLYLSVSLKYTLCAANIMIE